MLHPEQTLQLQLEVSETLTRQTTRDGIGLALAGVLNKVVPFQFFLHSIWKTGATSGYRISSAKNENGEFETIDDVELERLRERDFESFVKTGQFLSDPSNSGIYTGANFKALADQYPSFGIAYYHHGIRSMLTLFMSHENGYNHSMVISDRNENAFTPDFFQTIQTILPQLKMAFDNLFKYEELRQEEENKRTQLELNNVLLNHTNRDAFGMALAQVINKRVPCERFIMRLWSGQANLGHRLPLLRNQDGTFSKFSDTAMVGKVEQDPAAMIESSNFMADNPGIYQGKVLQEIIEQFPLFALASREFNIHSIMVLSFKAQGKTCLLILGNSATQSFQDYQFDLMQLLLPQIILAFSNLLNYESLREQEAVRSLQLQVNNILMGHTNREDFALALAEVINKTVPCERFIIRTWTGDVNLGYRIPMKRRENGTFERFSEWPMIEHAEQNPQSMVQGSTFMADSPGIYQGEEHRKLREKYPLFALGAKMFEVHSSMVYTMKVDNTTCLMILGNNAEISFNEGQYELIKTLLPQIILALENLFKYEKMREEELERTTQLNVLTAFNSQKDINEMALDAISRINEYIPFEYWFNITTILTRSESQFRIGVKKDNNFYGLIGEEVFKKLDISFIHSETFIEQCPFLFEKPMFYVADDFEELQKSHVFFEACREKLKLKSLATFPLATTGQVKTVVMMGSTRNYAFNEQDMLATQRIIPYISMAAQQYYSLVQIQTLTSQLEMEKNYLVEEIKSNYNFDEIIGASHQMKEVFKQISQVAGTDSTVLILGETGTGKELIARAVHDQSPRKGKVLIKVNCASLPAQLIESELFGHEKGSFTGAFERRIGKFELANGGTIFLDEMGELPIELQAKLLRVLQEREIERIGGKETISLDVRIIAATNRDLETEVAEGRFRSDLFYRLNIFPIHLPPLRKRKEDIPMLIAHFLQRFSSKMNRPIRSLKDDVLQEMIHYEWPGNIRELENVIEQSVIVGDVRLRKPAAKKNGGPPKPKEQAEPIPDGSVSEAEIMETLRLTKGKIAGPGGAAAILNLRASKIEEYERKWILETLRKTGGRIRGEHGAAELIGMKPTTLEARVKKLMIGKAEIFS